MKSKAHSGNLPAVLPEAPHPLHRLRPFGAAFGLTFLIVCFASCDKKEDGKAKQAPESSPKKAVDVANRPEAGAIAHVPVGKFDAGSLPGQPGRNPALEPIQTPVELGPFRIDTYPFPGDPTQPPRLGVSASEAQALCASKGGRLCTELEWERACRGADSSLYPGGNEPCEKGDDLCLSGFEVAKMGSIPEWTASHFGKGSDESGKAVARGAPSKTPARERRCAHRFHPNKDEPAGFRCCYGAPNAKTMKEPALGAAYEEVELKKADLAKLLEANERTKELAKDLSLFKPEAARTVLARGPGETMGFTLTTHAVRWRPVRGAEFLVVTGKSGEKTSFVLAYYVAGDQKNLAGSFIMKNEPGPIALAYAKSIRPRIHFSSCWGCPGETGKVLFRPPEELVLLQP